MTTAITRRIIRNIRLAGLTMIILKKKDERKEEVKTDGKKRKDVSVHVIL